MPLPSTTVASFIALLQHGEQKLLMHSLDRLVFVASSIYYGIATVIACAQRIARELICFVQFAACFFNLQILYSWFALKLIVETSKELTCDVKLHCKSLARYECGIVGKPGKSWQYTLVM